MTEDSVISERSGGHGHQKEIPVPSCKNTNRKTHKCRRMCCRRQNDRITEDAAPGVQTRIDSSGSPRQQLLGWFNRDR